MDGKRSWPANGVLQDLVPLGRRSCASDCNIQVVRSKGVPNCDIPDKTSTLQQGAQVVTIKSLPITSGYSRLFQDGGDVCPGEALLEYQAQLRMTRKAPNIQAARKAMEACGVKESKITTDQTRAHISSRSEGNGNTKFFQTE